jgi:hypothetical protein
MMSESFPGSKRLERRALEQLGGIIPSIQWGIIYLNTSTPQDVFMLSESFPSSKGVERRTVEQLDAIETI